MDIYQTGTYHKEISEAEIENVVEVINKASRAIESSEIIDHKLSAIKKMRVRQRRLKDELRYVLEELGIPVVSVSVFRQILCDEVVPDTVAESSKDVVPSQSRKRNLTIDAVTQFKEQVQWISGETMNRVVNLVKDIVLINSRIEKMKQDMKAARNARLEFEQKRKDDRDGFKRLRDQFLEVSEIRGYIDALIDLAMKYPSVTTTDGAIQAMADQFDRMCVTWRRYSRKLYNSVNEFKEKYAKEFEASKMEIPFTSQMGLNYFVRDFAAERDIDLSEFRSFVVDNTQITYNAEKHTYEALPTRLVLLNDIAELLRREEGHQKHYTKIRTIRKTAISVLGTLSFSMSVLSADLERELLEWSGGKANVLSNPRIKKIIDKAREAVLSPVRATITSPLKRDAAIEGSLRDFDDAVKGVKKVRQFIEEAPNKIREALAERAEKASRGTLRTILLFGDVPTKNNRNGLMPVEDAVRERVRKRYGNIPFEDEVNVGTEDKPKWVKEVYAEQVEVENEKGGIKEVWMLKSDAKAAKLIQSVDDQTKTMGE